MESDSVREDCWESWVELEMLLVGEASSGLALFTCVIIREMKIKVRRNSIT